jgi:hypothetical protein
MENIFKTNKFLYHCFYALIFLMFVFTFTPAQGYGKFVLSFEMPNKAAYKELAEAVKDTGHFQSVIKGVNRDYTIPADIKVRFAMGDQVDYLPESKQIIIGYEFLYSLAHLYTAEFPKAKNKDIALFTIRVCTFVLYQKLALAFINVHDIPVVGGTERAIDNLAIVFALEYSHGGYDIVMDAAVLYDVVNYNRGHDSSKAIRRVIDVDSKRFHNVICMAYGKHPKEVMAEFKRLGAAKLLERYEDNADHCKKLYDSQFKAWSKLLKPYATR